MDIWSSDDEEGEKIDLWRDDKGKAQPAAKTEEKFEGLKFEKSAKKKEKSVEGKETELKKEETEKQKKDEEEKKGKGSLTAKRDEKTLASIWELLMNSKAHREALVLALDYKKLPISISPEQIVCSLKKTPLGAMVFIDKDLPLEGRDHHKALFIKAEVKMKLTCCVMVDNGSAINVCPFKMLPKLGLTKEELKPSEIVIKAYDDTKRPVAGTFRALVKIGPIEE